MSPFKIIVCIILAIISLYVGFLHEDLRELKGKATDKEKKAITILEFIAFYLPLTIAGIITSE
jgi:hypothetical protein